MIWILKEFIGQAMRIEVIAAHDISGEVKDEVVSLKNCYSTDYKVPRLLPVASKSKPWYKRRLIRIFMRS